jgi:methionyl aminopeptidase
VDKFYAKSEEEIEIMAECGQKLARVKKALFEKVAEGVSAWEIEELAVKLIKEEGAEASFKKVPGYSWATCVNLNSGLVHGIPKKETVFKKGDVVSVDLGLYFKGFHTDCSFSKGIDVDPETQRFLDVGIKALKNAISATTAGNRVYDISEAIEKTVVSEGYKSIRALVGHGIGRNLHEDPQIPCFLPGDRLESMEISEGATFAIEVMYTQGGPDLVQDEDGWTIATQDGKISALFEETVAVVGGRPKVLADFF